MSENHWREVALDELTTVRIVCRHKVSRGGTAEECGAVIEIPLEKLAGIRNCPICENLLKPIVDINEEQEPYPRFVAALRRLQSLGTVRISFVLPADKPGS